MRLGERPGDSASGGARARARPRICATAARIRMSIRVRPRSAEARPGSPPAPVASVRRPGSCERPEVDPSDQIAGVRRCPGCRRGARSSPGSRRRPEPVELGRVVVNRHPHPRRGSLPRPFPGQALGDLSLRSRARPVSARNAMVRKPAPFSCGRSLQGAGEDGRRARRSCRDSAGAPPADRRPPAARRRSPGGDQCPAEPPGDLAGGVAHDAVVLAQAPCGCRSARCRRSARGPWSRRARRRRRAPPPRSSGRSRPRWRAARSGDADHAQARDQDREAEATPLRRGGVRAGQDGRRATLTGPGTRGRRRDPMPAGVNGARVIPNPDDPFGMADLGFAQAPRGLADRRPLSSSRCRISPPPPPWRRRRGRGGPRGHRHPSHSRRR